MRHMRKSEEKRPDGGKRVRFDKDEKEALKGDKVVVTETKRKDGGKHVRFDNVAPGATIDTAANITPKEVKTK